MGYTGNPAANYMPTFGPFISRDSMKEDWEFCLRNGQICLLFRHNSNGKNSPAKTVENVLACPRYAHNVQRIIVAAIHTRPSELPPEDSQKAASPFLISET